MIQCMISEQSISDFYQAQPVTQNPQLFVDKRLCYLHVMESLEGLTSDPGCSTGSCILPTWKNGKSLGLWVIIPILPLTIYLNHGLIRSRAGPSFLIYKIRLDVQSNFWSIYQFLKVNDSGI